MKYEYKFVTVKQNIWGSPKENYKKIIEEHAKEGWRFVQIIGGHYESSLGSRLEIIFERLIA